MELEMSDVDMSERPSLDGRPSMSTEIDLDDDFDSQDEFHPDPLDGLQSARSTITIPVKTYQAFQLGIVGLILLLTLSCFFFISMYALNAGDSDNTPSPVDQTTYGEGHLTMQELEELAVSVNNSIDFDVDPCQDFYQFSCGKWIENTEIPADRSGWYKSFSVIDARNEVVLAKILKDDWPLLGTFYENCMDMKTRDAVGTAPLTPFLEEVAKLEDGDSEGLAKLIAYLNIKGVSGFFDIAIEPNLINPSVNNLYVDQGGMGLPTKDYYFGESEHDIYIQQEYKNHMARLFALAGVGEGEEERIEKAERVFEVEKRLSKFALTPTERRNPYALYNPNDVVGLVEICPDFEWVLYFESMGIVVDEIGEMDITEPYYLGNLSVFLNESKNDYTAFRDYLTLRSISSISGWLTTEFDEEVYRWSGILSGASQPPNERICLGRVSSILGELLGRYFVNSVFDDRSKSIALDMINRIEDAFVDNLDDVEWMDEETAKLAVEKMQKITNKIGYPDKWKSYGKLKVVEGDFYSTLSSYIEMSYEEEIAKINKPVDKSKWFMNPQVVNAYYNPPGNEIVFPAAILQPSFFERRYPIAFNFGGIGMVMGHELSHGFDDQGRQFNGDGQLVQWWSDEAIENFDDAAQCVVELYGNYSLHIQGEDYPVNGYLTLGENIADLGGVTFAFNAYQKLRARMEEEQREKREEKVEWPYYPEKDIQNTFGFSSDQLFFISMAQNWCSLVRDDSAIQHIATDPHSPNEFRVKGPMSQTPQFAEAFSCPVDTPMHPETHCKVW